MTPFLDVAPVFATARDGTRLSYRLLPGGAGKRIVLTHSLGMTGEFWLRVAEPLRQIADVVVWDCRGHGASDKPPGPYSVGQFADDLADVLDAAGWFSAVAAGCSLGGCVCMAFAGRYPERAEALGLIDTSAWYGPQAREIWRERADAALDHGMQALVKSQPPRWFSKRFLTEHPGQVEAAGAVLFANDPQAYAATCDLFAAMDLREILPRIATPTAVIVGAEDFATPVAMSEEIRRLIPGATLQVVEGAGHFIPLEQPETIAEAIAGLSLRG